MNIKVMALIISGMTMIGCSLKTDKSIGTEQINKKIETLKKEKDSLLSRRQELAEEEFKQKKSDDLKFALDQEILSKDVKINEQVLEKSKLQLDKKKYETKLVIISIVGVIVLTIIHVLLPKKKETKSWWFFHQLFYKKKRFSLIFPTKTTQFSL